MDSLELLKKTRDQILMFPENHAQHSWACSTSMCVAGHASALAGGKIGYTKSGMGFLRVNGVTESFSDFAQMKLELSDAERVYLFYCMDESVAIKRLEQIIACHEEGKHIEDLDISEYIRYDGEEEGLGYEW